jgi:TDG/mug DNA glycosylase family protein
MSVGRRPTKADLEQARGRPVDDLIGPGLRLLFVGINPGLWTAAVNAHFARPGNRFWPALYRAGITDHLVDASAGLAEADAAALVGAGIGITNFVNVATARADELTAVDLRNGAERLRVLVASVQPRVVAVLGLTAYRAGFGVARAATGRQSEAIDGAELWVLPNPSGLNAHASLDGLAGWFRAAAEAADVRVHPPSSPN